MRMVGAALDAAVLPLEAPAAVFLASPAIPVPAAAAAAVAPASAVGDAELDVVLVVVEAAGLRRATGEQVAPGPVPASSSSAREEGRVVSLVVLPLLVWGETVSLEGATAVLRRETGA